MSKKINKRAVGEGVNLKRIWKRNFRLRSYTWKKTQKLKCFLNLVLIYIYNENRFTPSSCKDRGIIKFDLVAEIHFKEVIGKILLDFLRKSEHILVHSLALTIYCFSLTYMCVLWVKYFSFIKLHYCWLH